MLAVVGAKTVDALFEDIPPAARLERPVDLPDGMSEIDLARHMRGLSARNRHAGDTVVFAGAGCYDHHIPSVVDHVVRRPEFFTAYTPYQPEVSQGTLQAIYEYQTMVCELTAMDVANASMYDGATAFVEAALMACRLTRRSRVLVAGSVLPEWAQALSTYASSGLFEAVTVPARGGAVDPGLVRESITEDTAAVLVASPNMWGCLEEVGALARAAHDGGALLVVAANPVLLGLLEPPGALGADIVVAEGQSLGGSMSFGGPGLGLFACRSEHLRQLPGRLVGRTVDVDGSAAFVLTLSTREQHIRREKATSNICSNHALNALATGVHLCALGARGLADIARASMAKARYLRDGLIASGRFKAPWERPFGYEFALTFDGDLSGMRDRMMERGYLAGVPMPSPEGETVVFAVTEKRTRQEMDAFIREVGAL